ncbi:MAG: glycosyltransferase family 4 protein [Actinomycetota bacterium]
MRILIAHGYLLKGTGSNQYVQSLARAFCGQGHHLLVTCQDDDPDLDFVSVFMSDEAGLSAPRVVWEKETEYPGSCMVVKPDIGGLLPVYVMDSYEGFRVKEFPDLSDDELHAYIELNRGAHTRLVEQFVPDAVLANHAVMLPAILRPVAEAAEVSYFVCIHGSAIDFTVRRDDRYLHYGALGLAGAHAIFVPSEHSREQVLEVFADRITGLEERLLLVPPGVDTDLFDLAKRDFEEAVGLMGEEVAARTASVRVGDFLGRGEDGEASGGSGASDFARDIAWINGLHPEWLPEPDVTERLGELAESERPFVMFLGKLLETKGVQCILPALPLVMRGHPGLALVVVGFGEQRGMLQLMLQALADGDLLRLKRLSEYGNREYRKAEDAFEPVLRFLEGLSDAGEMDEYIRSCREGGLVEAVTFTGYLTQEEHRHILPYAKALLVPSLAPEAFGLVATEAMACGVVPIASRHSGLRSALEPLEGIWGDDLDALRLEDGEGIVRRIASAVSAVLDMPADRLASRGREMRSVVSERFSWDAVAARMVDSFDEE